MIMAKYAVFGLAPAVLMAIGCLLLAARRWRHRQGRLDATGAGARALAIAGWSLVLLGAFSLIALVTQAAWIVACVVAAVVLVAVVCRYQAAERQALLRLLEAAAERGIPLEAAARAFAAERADSVGIRARDLADYLEAGVPLALALRRSRNRVPAAVLLAAELGERTGTLAEALRQAVGEIDELELALRSMLEKFLYLATVALLALASLAFLTIKIIPLLVTMAKGLDLSICPPTTQLMRLASPNSPVFAVATVALAGLLLVAVLWYARSSHRNLPGVRILWRRADGALVLRWLAISVERNRPIGEMLQLLASYFPQAPMRARLRGAVRRIDAGAPWCDSLRRAGVLRRAESAVLRAAERSGNLAWALKEMADGSMRRLVNRLRAWLSLAFPAGVILVGVCVAWIVLGVIMPIAQLIMCMGQP